MTLLRVAVVVALLGRLVLAQERQRVPEDAEHATMCRNPKPGNERAPGLKLPKPISLPDPEYPDAPRRANIGGTVELQLEIGADGLVKSACVLRSSKHAELDASALTAVRTWRWHPARKDGTPIDYTMNVEETFSPR